MSNMDELLRRALMEANTLDAEEISAPPGRSAHYQRERLRLCASPFGWARQQAKPLWKRMRMRQLWQLVMHSTISWQEAEDSVN